MALTRADSQSSLMVGSSGGQHVFDFLRLIDKISKSLSYNLKFPTVEKFLCSGIELINAAIFVNSYDAI